MTRNAKTLPRSRSVAVWRTSEGADWQRYEVLCARESGNTEFRFDEKSKIRIIDAIELVGETRLKIEPAKKQIRMIIKHLKRLNLPDQHLLRPGSETEPNDFLMNIGFGVFQEVFENAMRETLYEAAQGKSVLQRLANYAALLRSNKAVLELPRAESMAAYIIKEEFEANGVEASYGNTWSSGGAEEGSEIISAFEAFALEYVMTDLGSDKNARDTLRRRILEAKKYITN